MSMILFSLALGAINVGINWGLYRFIGNKWVRMVISLILSLLAFILLTNVSPFYMHGIDNGDIGLTAYLIDLIFYIAPMPIWQYMLGSWTSFKNIFTK